MRLKKFIRKWSGNRGSALTLALVFTLIFAIVTSYVLFSSVTQTRVTYRTRLNTNSLEGARHTLDTLATNLEYIVSERPPQLGGKITTMNDVIHDLVPKQSRNMEPVMWSGQSMTWLRDRRDNDTLEFELIEDPADEYFGYTTQRLDYDIISFAKEDVNIADQLGYEGVGLRQRVTVDYIPLYQYAIFYDGDLELHPGPTMTVGGRTHSNGDMYLSSGNSIKFMGDVTSAGRIMRWKDERGNFQGGRVEVRDDDMNWQRMAGGDANGDGYLDHLDANWLEESSTRWDLNVRDVSHGVLPLRPPLPTGTELHDLLERAEPGEDDSVRRQKFEYQADIIITGNPADESSIKFWQSTYDDATATRTVVGPVDNPTVSGKKVVQIGEFYDGQQLTVVRTLDVDLGRLRNLGSVSQNGATISGDIDCVYVSTTHNEGYNDAKTLKDGFPAYPASMQDPVYERDANGNIEYNSKGNPKLVSAGWMAQDGNPPGTKGYDKGGSENFSGRGTAMPAVRVINGAELPTQSGGTNAFAFYTDRPLYIAGDLNNTNRKTAVFGGDAVTITSVPMALAVKDTNGDGRPDTTASAADGGVPANTNIESNNNWGFTHDMGNNWNNSSDYNYNDWGNRRNTKSNTDTNAIIIMGNVPSEREADGTMEQGSGGAHNVMRYLERWTKKHNFEGSMIVLYESEVAANIYRNDGYNSRQQYYSPPSRTYNWDPALQAAEPPPGMPLVVKTSRKEMQRISLEDAIAYKQQVTP